MGEISCSHCHGPLAAQDDPVCGACFRKAIASGETRRIVLPGHDIKSVLEYHDKEGNRQDFPCTIFIDTAKGLFGVKKVFDKESPIWVLPLPDVIDAVRRNL